MYDIKQLEEEWKRYRKKKLKPWYIGSSILLLLIISTSIFLMNETIDFSNWKHSFGDLNEVSTKEDNSKDTVGTTTIEAKQHVLINDALNRLEIKESVIDISEKVEKTPRNNFVDVPVLDDMTEVPAEEGIQTKNKMHLDIVESTSATAYRDVERRFFESHDMDDALFLARTYYRKGNYEKSLYWALEINKLDEDIEEGLLIFVKSKVKLGRKNEAISILSTYLKRSGSQEAKKLLYRIENDKL